MDTTEALIVRMAANVLSDGMFASEIGPRCTCTEAEALARLIALALGEGYAQAFITMHAEGDEDEEDMHHDQYLQLQQSVVD